MTDPVQFYLPSDLVDGLERVAEAWGVELDYLVDLALSSDRRTIWKTLSRIRAQHRKVLMVDTAGAKYIAYTTAPVLCTCCKGGCKHPFRWRDVIRCGCDAGM